MLYVLYVCCICVISDMYGYLYALFGYIIVTPSYFRVYFSVHIWYIMRRCVFSVFSGVHFYVISDVIIHLKSMCQKHPKNRCSKHPQNTPQKPPKIDPYFDPQIDNSEKPAKTCLFLPHFDACFWTCPEYPQIRPILDPPDLGHFWPLFWTQFCSFLDMFFAHFGVCFLLILVHILLISGVIFSPISGHVSTTCFMGAILCAILGTTFLLVQCCEYMHLYWWSYLHHLCTPASWYSG